MPFPGFEAACVAIIVITLAVMARRQPLGELLGLYVLLAIAGWIGEQTCISFYEHYGYALSWHGRIGSVPVLIPLIWPLVILSGRDVARALLPRSGAWAAVLVGAIVAFDASLVEVIAVRAGLWGWAEPGHLGVPVLGILGWGFFGALADLALGRPARQRPLALVGALAGTHLLIVAAWWACFRWTLRGALGDASVVGVCVLGALALVGGVAAIRRGGGLPIATALPRMGAASLFFAVLAIVAPWDGRLWLHVAAVATPYLAVTALTARRSPAAPL